MRGSKRWLAAFSLVLIALAPARGSDGPPLDGVKRVVFLGDSITYAGGYVEFVEAFLRLKHPETRVTFLDLGLPSETVSGLSEPGHASGAFPRPELAERLGRVLKKTQPDLIVACYGMNDGIYAPFDASRFARFKKGMLDLRVQAAASGAKVLHVTPPVFDPVPLAGKTLPAGRDEYRQPYEGYDDVLARYSAWLLEMRGKGWDVVDVHGPIKTLLEGRRVREPKFKLAADGVHIDATGHWLMAKQILIHWGVPPDELEGDDARAVFAKLRHGLEVLELVQRRQGFMKDAQLTSTGHKRPGMHAGLDLKAAEAKAKEIDASIRAALAGKRTP